MSIINNSNCGVITTKHNRILIQSSDGMRNDNLVSSDVNQLGMAINLQNVNDKSIKTTFKPTGQIPEVDWHVKQALERPMLVATGTILPSSTVGSQIFSLNLPNQYFQAVMSKAISSAFIYFRADINVLVSVQSTPFNSGLFILAPNYGNNFLTSPSSIHSMYVRQHAMLDISDNSCSATIKIPYKYYRNYLAPYSEDLCSIDLITVASPSFGAGGTTSAAYTITMWCSDVSVQIPRISVLAGDRIYTQGFSLFDNSSTTHITQLKDVENATLPVNMKGDQFDLEVGVSAMDAPTNTIAPTMVKIKEIGEMSNAINVQNIEKMILYPEEVTMNDFNTFGTDEDEMSMSFLVSRDSYVSTSSVDAMLMPGQIIYQMPVGPWMEPLFAPTDPNAEFDTCHLFNVSQFCDFWRGDIEYTFKFVCTRYHSCRIYAAVVYDREDPTSFTYNQLLSAYGMHMDINGESTEFKLRVPFLSDTNWKEMYCGGVPSDIRRYFPANLVLVLETPLQYAPGVATNIAMVITMKGCENYEVARPGMRNSLRMFIESNDTPTDLSTVAKTSTYKHGITPLASLKDVLRAYGQCGSMLGVINPIATGNIPVDSIFAVGFPVSVGAYANITRTFAPAFPDGYQAPVPAMNLTSDMIDERIQMFVGHRGSLRYKIVGNAQAYGTTTFSPGVGPNIAAVYLVYPDWPENSASDETRVYDAATYVYINNQQAKRGVASLGPNPVFVGTPRVVPIMSDTCRDDGNFALEFEVPFSSVYNYMEYNRNNGSDKLNRPPVLVLVLEGLNNKAGAALKYYVDFRVFRAIGDDFRFGLFNDTFQRFNASGQNLPQPTTNVTSLDKSSDSWFVL